MSSSEHSYDARWADRERSNPHPLRLSILQLLGGAEGHSLPVSEIGHVLEVPVSRASYHARVLAMCGLVTVADGVAALRS